MPPTGTLVAAWLTTNGLVIAAAMLHGTRKHHARQRAIAAAAMHERARRGRHGNRWRTAARTGLPFPIDHAERDWRDDDTRRRQVYARKLRSAVHSAMVDDELQALLDAAPRPYDWQRDGLGSVVPV